MDPKSTFLLEIRFADNARSRKDLSCFTIDMVVDSDICNFKDFLDEIKEKYPPGYLEHATVAYYDHVRKAHVEVKTDQDLLAMFAKHTDNKEVNMSIAYTLPTEIPIWPAMHESVVDSKSTQPTCSQPTHEASSNHDTTREPSTPLADDNILANPEPENEFVEVDEENHLTNASKSRASHDDDVFESESDSDKVYEEEDGLVGKDPVPPLIVAYDKEDPPMTPGSTYPNMDEFKLALSYHAIKKEFEFNTKKSDTGRMILHCSRKVKDRCKWRLYATTMDDEVTVEVNLLFFVYLNHVGLITNSANLLSCVSC
jgi:hypothetical protein